MLVVAQLQLGFAGLHTAVVGQEEDEGVAGQPALVERVQDHAERDIVLVHHVGPGAESRHPPDRHAEHRGGRRDRVMRSRRGEVQEERVVRAAGDVAVVVAVDEVEGRPGQVLAHLGAVPVRHADARHEDVRVAVLSGGQLHHVGLVADQAVVLEVGVRRLLHPPEQQVRVVEPVGAGALEHAPVEVDLLLGAVPAGELVGVAEEEVAAHVQLADEAAVIAVAVEDVPDGLLAGQDLGAAPAAVVPGALRPAAPGHVVAGEQVVAGGSTLGHGIGAGEGHARGGEAFDVGHGDERRRVVGRGVAPAHVVDRHDQDVGRAVRRGECRRGRACRRRRRRDQQPGGHGRGPGHDPPSPPALSPCVHT